MYPFISIVTVTYNAVLSVRKTIESVISQRNINYEYIIIDGGSTDGTLDIIKEFTSYISYFVSEPDSGIYDAMNKAIQVANGEWILFMNSGDCFFSNATLMTIFDENKYEDSDSVIYGDTIIQYPWGEILLPAKWFSPSDINLPFCHQSALTRTNVIKEILFDLKFKVAADYNLFYNIHKNGGHFRYINIPVSKYNSQGYSTTMVLRTYKEVAIINNKNSGAYYYYRLLSFYFRAFIEKIVPSQAWNMVRKIKYGNYNI